MRPARLVLILILAIAGGSLLAGRWRTNSCALAATWAVLGGDDRAGRTGVSSSAESPACASSRCSYPAGVFEWAQGEYTRARESFLCSADSRGGADLEGFWVGRSYLLERRRQEAIEYWTRAGFPADHLQALGQMDLRQGKYQESTGWYDLAAAIAKDSAEIECERAEAYERAGLIDLILEEHLVYLSKGLASGKDLALECLYRAGYHAIDGDQVDLGLELWEPILALDSGPIPEDELITNSQVAYTHFRVASIYRERSDPAGERLHLEKVVEWGQDLDAWYVNQARTRLSEPF
jgi:tetratricopeptide (TPR) repeat protein